MQDARGGMPPAWTKHGFPSAWMRSSGTGRTQFPSWGLMIDHDETEYQFQDQICEQ